MNRVGMGQSCPSPPPPDNALAIQIRNCSGFPPFRRDRLEEGPQIINAAGRGGSRSCEAPLAQFRVGRGPRDCSGEPPMLTWLYSTCPAGGYSSPGRRCHGPSRSPALAYDFRNLPAPPRGFVSTRQAGAYGSAGPLESEVSISPEAWAGGRVQSHQDGQGRQAWGMSKGRRGAYVSFLPRGAARGRMSWTDAIGVI